MYPTYTAVLGSPEDFLGAECRKGGRGIGLSHPPPCRFWLGVCAEHLWRQSLAGSELWSSVPSSPACC